VLYVLVKLATDEKGIEHIKFCVKVRYLIAAYRAGESEPDRPEPHDLIGAGAEAGAILCFRQDRSGSRSTFKNWNGAGAGVGADINQCGSKL